VLLNLMPCVLPVLAIKLFALAQLAQRSRRVVLIHVLAYTAGIELTQLLLAGLVALLRAAGVAVGWGFQFQEPIFLAGISTLLVFFALNLFGVFEIQLASGRLADLGARATGARRSFFEGLLAVALATPCTAPFLGTAVGFAFAGSAPVIAAIFLAIGLGLALPFALVALAPGLVRRLPRSGAWMGELRHVLGFALLGTVAWLLWLLGRNAGADAVAALLFAFVALAFAVRLLGLAQSVQRVGASAAAALAALAFAVGGINVVGFEARRESAAGPALPARPFDAQQVRTVVDAGGRAFVYFTADWCLTCKVNERRVLAHPRLQAALASRGFEIFRADWTQRDDTIRSALAGFGRAGVPLYVLYHGPDRATVLPEILTLDGVISALDAG
jgi:thiol:disulfide interchange protein DsbD